MPKVKVEKKDKKIVIKGEDLYLAKEKLKTRELFFDVEIINKEKE